MTIEKFRKAQELDLRKAMLLKAIKQLEDVNGMRVNINGFERSDTKFNFVRIGKDDHFFIQGSDKFFLNVNKQTVDFLKKELELVEQDFNEL